MLQENQGKIQKSLETSTNLAIHTGMFNLLLKTNSLMMLAINIDYKTYQKHGPLVLKEVKSKNIDNLRSDLRFDQISAITCQLLQVKNIYWKTLEFKRED